MNTVTSHSIILFDDTCILCNKYALFIAKNDIHDTFRFATLNGETAKEISRKSVKACGGRLFAIEERTIFFRPLSFAKALTNYRTWGHNASAIFARRGPVSPGGTCVPGKVAKPCI